MGIRRAALLLILAVASAATAQQPAWPSSTDALVFRWENGSESNTVDSGGPVARLCRLVPSGEARFNRFWAMAVAGGKFDAEATMAVDLLAAVRTGAFAFEVVLTPARTDYPRPEPLAKFGPLILAQHGERLVVEHGDDSAVLGTVAAGEARHLIINVAGTVTAYLDGRGTTDTDMGIDPAAWFDAHLSFGGSPWRGEIEGVAIYHRTVGGAEAIANHRAYRARMATRTELPPLTMRARLVRKRDVPRATAYPDSLVVFDYRVELLLAGAYGGEKVLVAHYGNLNGERRRATADLRAGRMYRLELEPFDDHPQLAALHRVSNHDDVHLPLFFAVTDPVPD